jgi:hypothetical protein
MSKSLNQKPNLSLIKRKARSLFLKRTTKTVYVPVTKNIYFDGLSFRVRVIKNKQRNSKNFSNIQNALNFKLSLLNS